MARAIGIGGAFLRTADPEELYRWYETHLKLKREHGCFVFSDSKEGSGSSTVAFFPRETEYFGPARADGSWQPAMLNFRVEGLDELLDGMAAAGVEVDPKRESYGFGKFGWFKDPEGNRVELWEPVAD